MLYFKEEPEFILRLSAQIIYSLQTLITPSLCAQVNHTSASSGTECIFNESQISLSTAFSSGTISLKSLATSYILQAEFKANLKIYRKEITSRSLIHTEDEL